MHDYYNRPRRGPWLAAFVGVAAANLIRLDDDPDAAEPRIAEREVEHG